MMFTSQSQNNINALLNIHQWCVEPSHAYTWVSRRSWNEGNSFMAKFVL